MCPDRQLVSMYIDGEVPSPWKEKLEAHLASCPSCASRADEFRRVSAILRGTASEAAPAAMENARARVWKNLVVRTPPPRRVSNWSRPLVLPIPAAIAAVLVVAVVAAGSAGIAMNPNAKSVPAVAIQQVETPAIPVSDMGSVLHYLDSQDSGGNIVIIHLPENSNFAFGGEPTIVRAADYTGRVTR